MKEFFRPSLWDILGVLTGLTGLALTGAVIVVLEADGWLVAALSLSVFLVYVGARAVGNWAFGSRFPFGGVSHNVTLEFRIDDSSGKRAVKAKLTRETVFCPRLDNLTLYDRYQLVPDDPLRSAEDVRATMDHKFHIDILKPKYLPYWISRSEAVEQRFEGVACKPKFDRDRPLKLEFAFPQDMKNFGKRFKLTEVIELPNDFSEPNEFYVFEANVPAKLQNFQFIFPDFKVNSASVIIQHGSRRGPAKRVDVVQGGRGSSFSKRFYTTYVGSKIRFQWNWEGLKEIADPANHPPANL